MEFQICLTDTVSQIQKGCVKGYSPQQCSLEQKKYKYIKRTKYIVTSVY